MHFTIKDFKRYIFFILLFVWFIIFAHLFYIYMGKKGEKKPVKGGVLIESFLKLDNKNITPVPYFGNNYYSKYLQSLLFRGCLNSKGEEDLCKIQTNDQKIFIVSLSGNNYWSDDRKITIDDVYFTYNDIISHNTLGLINPIFSNISSIKKIDNNTLKITFASASINNKSFFKNYILPKHILKGKNKQYFKYFISNLVNSTCVKLDNKSDYVNNIIYDFKNCSDYYINKYQVILINKENEIKQLLTGNNKVDLYDAYENINKDIFNKYKITFDKRYALFWNTKKQKSSIVKAYLSKIILDSLKNNLTINQKLDFNGYGLFMLPKVSLNKTGFIDILSKKQVEAKQKEFLNNFVQVKDVLNYNTNKTKFFIKNKIEKNLLIKGKILTGNYEKIGISANLRAEYFPKSYNKQTKTFKYIISEKFKNIKEGKNIYTIYGYSGDNRTKIGDITIFYKKINYPKFDVNYKDLVVLYLNNNLTKAIGDSVVSTLKKVYPANIIAKSLDVEDYKKTLLSGDYDLVISSVDLKGKDISAIFKTNDVLSNPSNFVNPNFASLITQNLLSIKKLKDKVFSELNKIYQENIPVVFIGNEKIYLFIKKKYNPKELNYTYFENRKKFLKSVVIKRVKQASLEKTSIKGFIEFLKQNINAK